MPPSQNSKWLVNRPFLWRLRQLPFHLTAGSHTLVPRHYRRFKQRLEDLPPCEDPAASSNGGSRLLLVKFELAFYFQKIIEKIYIIFGFTSKKMHSLESSRTFTEFCICTLKSPTFTYL
jgi:hypothetical protein